MKVKVHEPKQYQRRVEVTLPSEQVDAAFREAFAQLKKGKIRVPGFRKGRIPNSVLYGRFRKSIDAEVLNSLMKDRIPEILDSRKLQPVNQPTLDMGTPAQGSELSFSIEFEVIPDVDMGGLEELAVEVPALELSEAEVDSELHALHRQDAQIRPVEDRDVVQEGDIVVVDYKMTPDGQETRFKEGVSARVGFEMILPGFTRGLVDAVVGEPKEFDLILPDAHSDKELSGKPAHFEVVVKEIREELLPDMDDEWARDHEKDTLEELRDSVKQELGARREKEREGFINDRILDKLIETHPFEIPPSMAKREAEERIAQIREVFAKASSVKLDPEYLRKLHKDARDQVYLQIRRMTVLRSLIEQQGIEVSDEDTEQRISELADKAKGQPAAKVRAHYSSEEARQSLAFQIREERALAFLRSNIRIVTVPAEDSSREEGE